MCNTEISLSTGGSIDEVSLGSQASPEPSRPIGKETPKWETCLYTYHILSLVCLETYPHPAQRLVKHKENKYIVSFVPDGRGTDRWVEKESLDRNCPNIPNRPGTPNPQKYGNFVTILKEYLDLG